MPMPGFQKSTKNVTLNIAYLPLLEYRIAVCLRYFQSLHWCTPTERATNVAPSYLLTITACYFKSEKGIGAGGILETGRVVFR